MRYERLLQFAVTVADALSAAERWKEATTKAAREQLAMELSAAIGKFQRMRARLLAQPWEDEEPTAPRRTK